MVDYILIYDILQDKGGEKMPRDVSLETVQNYFNMYYNNENLIFNSNSEEQLSRAVKLKIRLENIMKDLYVPNSPITT